MLINSNTYFYVGGTFSKLNLSGPISPGLTKALHDIEVIIYNIKSTDQQCVTQYQLDQHN